MWEIDEYRNMKIIRKRETVCEIWKAFQEQIESFQKVFIHLTHPVVLMIRYVFLSIAYLW